uniref:Cytochrome b6 n=1 Tax=Heterosigma akashiwo TaxID=2829 RepID=A0A224ANB7_HETAK|nr:cytochrome b6 [Heterosigma akashiwo]BBA18365.1 cytochrome b6 [Heterosigma akashiwo]BBA18504.1 cytochrome b6 [Heterosigma akashiwo]BBA18642.1 cytochrome b6 [Heterosigma akashiwo]BBA18781.1 cytochrome b6 [Heterosigma akashiwo]
MVIQMYVNYKNVLMLVDPHLNHHVIIQLKVDQLQVQHPAPLLQFLLPNNLLGPMVKNNLLHQMIL